MGKNIKSRNELEEEIQRLRGGQEVELENRRLPDAPITGRKNDQGKDRWDLLLWAAVRAVVKVLTFGAWKYAPNNWMEVLDPQNRYFAAAMRHLVAWRDGEWLDLCESHGEHGGARPDSCKDCSGQPHLANAMCNIMFLFHFGPFKESVHESGSDRKATSERAAETEGSKPTPSSRVRPQGNLE